MYGSDAACRYACRTGACSRVGDRGRANKKSDKDRSRTGICNCRGVIERKKQEERITHHLHSPRLSECRQAAGGGELSENGSESG